MSEVPMRADGKLRNRIVFRLTGRWPQSVVSERLSCTTWDPSNVNAILAPMWHDAGMDYRPLVGDGGRLGAPIPPPRPVTESYKRKSGVEMTPREHLDDIKRLFVEGKLSVEEARDHDTYWRTRLIHDRRGDNAKEPAEAGSDGRPS